MVELLSPAGSHEAFMAGINNGANAVYLGLKDFSARQNANNFDCETLLKDTAYAHSLGVKVYVTVNTLIKNNELSNYITAIKNATKCGVDAFIVQDVFFGKLLKETFDGIELHLSTQAGVSNVYGAKLAKEYGFKRVVLARETTLDDIKKISQIIETEVFVQGALCTAFSGQCYFSSFIGGNSGNRGLCKQPCRKKYKYVVDGKTISDGYVLSLKDLCVDYKIRDLIEAGVKSFKIEGRMRRAEYVAAACKYYNNIIYGNAANKSELFRTYNRGDYTSGISFNDFQNIISNKIQNHKGEYVGKVLSVKKDAITIKSNERFVNGDCFKIISNGLEVGNAKIINGIIRYNGTATVGDDVNITTDEILNDKLLSTVKKLPVDVYGEYLIGKKPRLVAKCNGLTLEKIFDETLEQGQNQILTLNDFTLNLSKVDDYPFQIQNTTLDTNGVFLPKSVLNRHRRELFSSLFNKLSTINKSKVLYKDFSFDYVTHNKPNNKKRIAILASDFSFDAYNFITDLIFCPTDYNDKSLFKKFFQDAEKFSSSKKYLYLPSYVNSEDINILKTKLSGFDGVYGDGAYAIEFAKECDVELFYGLGVNFFNSYDLSLIKSKVALSKELSKTEIEKGGLIQDNTYVFDLGNILLMNLVYCPFLKNCQKCKATANNIVLIDEDKREYKVRRYKLSACRFEIYNESDLIYCDDKNFNELFNFNTYDTHFINQILKAVNDGCDLKEIIKKYTYGNLKRGVK